MSIGLRFMGAAQNVTGSRYVLETADATVLVDCGLYQERDLRERNWAPFAVPAQSIDAVVLTHAHLDHCGLLPKLVREGFRGPVICTAATAEIAKIVLLDSAKIQEEDAGFKKRRHQRERRKGAHPEIPLYTVEDAERALPLLSPVRYEEKVDVAKGVEAV
ncbi:MAG: MBL fold metallo-hydrolase, partial [Chloroflexi bacterium]|nr:MBL fold metallo-hydrolase [Chloroflexota bacterium]